MIAFIYIIIILILFYILKLYNNIYWNNINIILYIKFITNKYCLSNIKIK